MYFLDKCYEDTCLHFFVIILNESSGALIWMFFRTSDQILYAKKEIFSVSYVIVFESWLKSLFGTSKLKGCWLY